ncbi:hypothetical protein BY458DRAFT_560158 [Sporodiniella umbellata]|nr:hypothetical protein BY458DRAFT_560158 [Sporodiniella umbellata]
MNTLSPEQQKKLAEYQIATKSRDQQAALTQLAHHDWNVAKATERRLRPFRLFFWPLGLAWNLTRNMTWTLFFFACKTLDRFLIKKQGRIPYDFMSRFESMYGKRHLAFLSLGYQQALEKAREEKRPLLIILQSEEHDDTDTFSRHTLTSPALIEYMAAQGILVWAGDVKEREVHEVSHDLKATRYPFMALMEYKNHKLILTQRIHGRCGPEKLQGYLAAVCERAQQEEQRREERRLREEQDLAYYRSLEADQKKKVQAMQAKEAQARAQAQNEAQAQADGVRAAQKAAYVQYLYSQLRETPGEGQVTHLSFRLANGERVVRSFGEWESLDALYRFVQVVPLLGQARRESPCPEGYEHAYSFRLHNAYPRMEYAADAHVRLGQVPELWPSATLVVEEE